MSAEGETKLEAYEKLERMIVDRLKGANLFALEVNLTPPRLLVTGIAKKEPIWDTFLECIAENRRREDAENP